MLRKSVFVSLILFFTLSACSLHISLPFKEVGPVVVDEIDVPAPGAGSAYLTLKFSAGTLKLKPGADGLVSGTASYNIADFKPTVTIDGNNVVIEQGTYRIDGIPDLNQIKNEWDLELGTMPLGLVIEAGAYKAEYELGGLALTNLTIKDGASDVKLNFSDPNKVEMNTLRYETGASNATLKGLANANFAMLEFDSGAGNYTLDFTGNLRRDGSVKIETGLSNLTLVIPENLSVQITVEGGLSNVNIPAGWDKNGNIYTQEGNGPALTIIIEIGAGNLTITQ